MDLDLERGPPDSILFPTLADLERWEQGITDAVAIDIETAGEYIICVGLTQLDLESGNVGSSLCLRFRLKAGARYWALQDHAKAVEWLYDLLARSDLTLVFHNGVTFDVPALKAHGFQVKGKLLDTMLLMRAAYSEMKSRLEYCGTLWLGMPVWKTMVDDEDDK
jgi:hypothetical protein